MKKLSLIVLFLFVHYVNFVMATEYFVDASNTPPGAGTYANPYASYTTVQDIGLSPGDVVYFKYGVTWAGKATITGNGTSENPITLTSYGSSDGKGRAIIDATGQTQGIIANGKTNLNISNFEIIGNPSNTGVAVNSNETRVSSNIVIDNIQILQSQGGGIIVGTSYPDGGHSAHATGVVIKNSVAKNTGGHGVAVIGPYDGAIIENCIVDNPGLSSNTWGLYLGNLATKIQATDNGWTETPADSNIWVTNGVEPIKSAGIKYVIFSSETYETSVFLTEDASLDDPYDWYKTGTNEVTIVLEEGVQPVAPCGCSVLIVYDYSNKNGTIRYSKCSNANNDIDAVCIGADQAHENASIYGNLVEVSDGPAISLHLPVGGTVFSNVMSQCGQDSSKCMHVSGTKAGSTVNIVHNTIEASQADEAVHAGGETGSTVNFDANVIVGGDVGVEPATTGIGTVSATNNVITSTTALGTGITDGGGNVTTNPQKVTSGYRLKSTSTIIDSAADLGDTYTYDYYGRNQDDHGTGWEPGAVAFVKSEGRRLSTKMSLK